MVSASVVGVTAFHHDLYVGRIYGNRARDLAIGDIEYAWGVTLVCIDCAWWQTRDERSGSLKVMYGEEPASGVFPARG